VISIRRVDGTAKQALLRQLQLLALPDDKPYDTRKGCWWIAYDDTRAAGFAGYVRSARWADTIYMCRAGVLPAFRGRKLQRRLIRVREQHARRAGMCWSITDTSHNPASSNNLIASGYRLYEPTIPWSYRRSLYWRKKL
jgi:GNAT superfamily N-acetyltransferase